MGTVLQGDPVQQGAHEDRGVGPACTHSPGQELVHGNVVHREGRGQPVHDAIARHHRHGLGPH
eukprot:9000116-Heterocapsa_arctica.AAC.1